MTRRALLLLAGVALLALVVFVRLPAVAHALQFGFVLAGAVPIGALVMLAIARLVGADWSAFAPLTRPLWLLVPLAVLAMAAQDGAALPDHLALWQHPLVVAVRAGLVMVALAITAARLRGGASVTAAGIILTLYAALVTPIADDWLLAGEPGHPVSAVGMMLFVVQIAAACAALLLSGRGPAPMRSDMAKLLVAALLGLGYLGFMDYLIVWFGNLPARVPFYVARTSPATGAIAVLALLVGLALPIATLSLRGERGQRVAAVGALAGLAAFVWWWLGGAILTLIGGLAVTVVAVALLGPITRETAHG